MRGISLLSENSYFLKKDSASWTDYVSKWLISVKSSGEWQIWNNTGALEL
jgi:hypothetical protein